MDNCGRKGSDDLIEARLDVKSQMIIKKVFCENNHPYESQKLNWLNNVTCLHHDLHGSLTLNLWKNLIRAVHSKYKDSDRHDMILFSWKKRGKK